MTEHQVWRERPDGFREYLGFVCTPENTTMSAVAQLAYRHFGGYWPFSQLVVR